MPPFICSNNSLPCLSCAFTNTLPSFLCLLQISFCLLYTSPISYCLHDAFTNLLLPPWWLHQSPTAPLMRSPISYCLPDVFTNLLQVPDAFTYLLLPSGSPLPHFTSLIYTSPNFTSPPAPLTPFARTHVPLFPNSHALITSLILIVSNISILTHTTDRSSLSHLISSLVVSWKESSIVAVCLIFLKFSLSHLLFNQYIITERNKAACRTGFLFCCSF